jgi:acyl carrier protein
MEINRADILSTILTSLSNTVEMTTGNAVEQGSLQENTRLIGHEAVLDSMGLVSLLLDVEQSILDQFDVVIIIADERAMSQKRSPFRSVETLTDYVLQLVKEQTESAGS